MTVVVGEAAAHSAPVRRLLHVHHDIIEVALDRRRQRLHDAGHDLPEPAQRHAFHDSDCRLPCKTRGTGPLKEGVLSPLFYGFPLARADGRTTIDNMTTDPKANPLPYKTLADPLKAP